MGMDCLWSAPFLPLFFCPDCSCGKDCEEMLCDVLVPKNQCRVVQTMGQEVGEDEVVIADYIFIS